jgi:hypothetical protein
MRRAINMLENRVGSRRRAARGRVARRSWTTVFWSNVDRGLDPSRLPDEVADGYGIDDRRPGSGIVHCPSGRILKPHGKPGVQPYRAPVRAGRA